MKFGFLLKTDSGYPRDAEDTLFTLANLSIPFALTPIGQLHQSPPSPVSLANKNNSCFLRVVVPFPAIFSVSRHGFEMAGNVEKHLEFPKHRTDTSRLASLDWRAFTHVKTAPDKKNEHITTRAGNSFGEQGENIGIHVSSG